MEFNPSYSSHPSLNSPHELHPCVHDLQHDHVLAPAHSCSPLASVPAHTNQCQEGATGKLSLGFLTVILGQVFSGLGICSEKHLLCCLVNFVGSASNLAPAPEVSSIQSCSPGMVLWCAAPKQSSDSLHERDGSLKQPGLAALSQLNSR